MTYDDGGYPMPKCYMKKNERIKEVLRLLDEYYPYNNECYLNYTHDYELLIANMLAAQCTDDRVNMVTSTLFKNYSSLEDFATSSQSEMEKAVHQTGFYRNKAKNIILTANILLAEHNGRLPNNIEELVKLPGVGRKTANVVLAHIFNVPTVIVDTHVKRISFKLGFTKHVDPEKIEYELMKILPKKHWIRYNHQIIAHGRLICAAIKPKCSECFLKDLCNNIAL